MKPIPRIIPAAAAFFLAFGITQAGSAIADPTPHPPLAALADGHAFSIDDARGRFLALHFVASSGSPAAGAFVRSYIKSAPTVAGVVHAFVLSDPADQVKAWAAQFGDDSSMVYLDKDGALAKDLQAGAPSAGDAVPETIVFDADGKELFRSVGTGPDDYLAFDRFSRQMADKSRPAALPDYNLPKDKALAVGGYDVVAYFTQNRAVPGKAEIASAYRGITYRFASEEDRRLFAADPKKYLPTYGGWCATAMGAKGEKVEIDPKSFKVKDGRLFLFYSGLFSDALKDWNKHESEWEPAADANWKKLTKEDPIKPSK